MKEVVCKNGHKYYSDTTIGKDGIPYDECPHCKSAVAETQVGV